MFNFFKKEKPDFIKLPYPDDSTSFFEAIKKESEIFWQDYSLNNKIYGFQIQPDTKWLPGLSDNELNAFENDFGFTLPAPLRNFYKTMNGLTKPAINIFGNSGIPHTFHPVYYSYPADKEIMLDRIEWIYEANLTKVENAQNIKIPKIFPVYAHRFMLVDIPGNPILSMYGDDIIYYADNLSKLLADEIFSGNIYNVSDFESPNQLQPHIQFWLD